MPLMVFSRPASGDDCAFEAQLFDLSGIPLVVAERTAALHAPLQGFVFEFVQGLIDMFQPASFSG